jgi:hypothetical protein
MTIRFLTDDEVANLVNPDMAKQGWAMLNVATARVAGIFDGDRLIKTLTLQLFPVLGPLLEHNRKPDSGEATRELVSFMETYFLEAQARGWMVIADSPITERLCKRYGMTEMKSPVFMTAMDWRPSEPTVQ